MPSNDKTHNHNQTGAKIRPFKPSPKKVNNTIQQRPQTAVIIQRARLDPGSLSPDDALHLQQTIGNQAVGLFNAPQSASVQRESMSETDDELQMKPLVQRRADEGGEAPADLESVINQARGNGLPLAPELQAQMGQAMGADFGGVRVHTDAQSDQLTQSIQAKAFTTGQDLFFRQGAYQPESRGGQALIAHELAHVVQQNREAVIKRPETNQTVRPEEKNGPQQIMANVMQRKQTIQRLVPGDPLPTEAEEREAFRQTHNHQYVGSPANKRISNTPSAINKSDLTLALRTTSIVQFLLDMLPSRGGIMGRGAKGPEDITERSTGLVVATGWEKLIADDNIRVNYHDNLGEYLPMDDGEEAIVRQKQEETVKREMKAKIEAANAIVHQIVDPTILVKMAPPRVTIMMEEHQRAYQADEGIKIANGDPTSDIVHEIGHYLEHRYSELWEDAAMLRRKRASEAGNLVTAEENDPGMEQEGRMAGNYPVTGKYTSKVYEAIGSTEVVSMTMEYMSSKEKLEQLLDNDPQQLGLVIRKMQPNDPELEAVFDQFHMFFPNSDANRTAIATRQEEREREQSAMQRRRRYPNPLSEPLLG
ncbi:MAG: DUF4157 domain-containing protein [Chloroflexi bacterium]|nr:MAG: DUF4157 domain-containing protein [Chloroflexota bacterium]